MGKGAKIGLDVGFHSPAWQDLNSSADFARARWSSQLSWKSGF